MDQVTLQTINHEARIDTRKIASGLGIEHKAVIQLIKTHKNDLEHFGQLPFEMEVGTRKQGLIQ